MYFADEPEHIAILRETLRRFVAAELPPEARRRFDREHTFPREVFAKLAALGVCGLTIEEEYGGQGRDLVAAVAVIEELCRGGAFGGSVHPLRVLRRDQHLRERVRGAEARAPAQARPG